MTSTSNLIAGAGSTASSLIKTDAKGRMHRTREQREHILDEHERSGLSGAGTCPNSGKIGPVQRSEIAVF
jgi:hypothetical protein